MSEASTSEPRSTKFPAKIAAIALITLGIIAALWFMRTDDSAKFPDQSTTETTPRDDIPPPATPPPTQQNQGSVTEGEDPDAKTTPDPAGGETNTLLQP